MGVPAELEIEGINRCLSVNFRTVRKENGALTAGNRGADGVEVVGFVEMRVIDSSNPKTLSAAFDRCDFVEQDGQAALLERGDHFEKIVIPQNPPTHGGESRRDVSRGPNARRIVAARLVAKVARDNDSIVWNDRDTASNDLRKILIEVGVKVGKLQETESVEGLREAREVPSLFDCSHVQKASPRHTSQAAESEGDRYKSIERHISLEAHDALALVKKVGRLSCLLEQPDRHQVTSETLLKLGVVRVLHRSGAEISRRDEIVVRQKNQGFGFWTGSNPNTGFRIGLKAGSSPSMLQKTSSTRLHLVDFSA